MANIVGTATDDELKGSDAADLVRGLDGNDYLVGGGGNDRLEGGDGVDILEGGMGEDLLLGGLGNDYLSDTEGVDDSLYGEDGDDRLSAFRNGERDFAYALLSGGAGDDFLEYNARGAIARADLDGGDGNDTIYVFGAGAVIVAAGSGADVGDIDAEARYEISLGAGGDRLSLRGYDDRFADGPDIVVSDFEVGVAGDSLGLDQYLSTVLQGWDQQTNPFASKHLRLIQRGADAVIQLDRDGSAGHYMFSDLVILQSINAGSLTAHNLGGYAANGAATTAARITGTAEQDILSGASGADFIRGMGGDDKLFGASGDDRLEGGDGIDQLDGELGNDLLLGGESGDYLTDSLGGNDRLYGEGGDDIIQVDRQRARGGRATLLLDGGVGDDWLTFFGRGQIDDVTLVGGDGNDQITAYGGGRITINAGSGADLVVIDAAAQSYAITLGTGSDIVSFGYSFAHLSPVIILDFLAGNGGDQLQLKGYLQNILTGWNPAANPFASGHLRLGQNGSDTILQVDFDGGGDGYVTLATLREVAGASLTAANLGFAPLRVATIGTGGADTLAGTAGNDEIDGGAGADTMKGGLGNDIYYVDNIGDRVTETAGQGNDTVISSISVNFGTQQIETLILTGSEALYGIGNELANTIIGNALDNIIDGRGGADAMKGEIGDDTYYVDHAGDRVTETRGQGIDTVISSISVNFGTQQIENLTLTGSTALYGIGNELANTITGNAGANIIDGRAGADAMKGGLGNDTYYVDNAGDRVTETAGQGNDTVISSISINFGTQQIENLTLTGNAALNGVGNELANTIIGNAGANIIDGRAGADAMKGGLGSDTYYVDNVGDRVTELAGQGTDTVISSISVNFGTQQIENLTLTGSAALYGVGNELANTIIGNVGENIIDGRGGADAMKGGLGNDTYYVDNAGDRVTELAGQGTDTVISSVSVNLGTQQIENLTLSGSAAINATGNALHNVIIGNAGANVLNGGAGADTLSGGGGADQFLFDSALSATWNVDEILDFSAVEDSILLDISIFRAIGGAGEIASSAFYTGSLAHDASDRIIYDDVSGNIYYDPDGNGSASPILFARVEAGLALNHADFIAVA